MSSHHKGNRGKGKKGHWTTTLQFNIMQPLNITESYTIAMEWRKVHDNEEKCTEQAYMVVTILRMDGKKIFHNTDQKH